MDDFVFLDTNILVYAANKDSPYHTKAKRVIERVNKGELRACLSPRIGHSKTLPWKGNLEANPGIGETAPN